MPMELYFGPGSCAFAALVALEEAGADYTPRRLVLAEGEHRKPEFLAINPLGRVPALVVDGTVITEVIAVLTFIAARYPQAGLLPVEDPVMLGKVYEWLSWLATNQHIAVAQLLRTERFADDPALVAGLRDAARPRLAAGFAEIERRIAGPWAMGERYTLLDGYLAVYRRWAERLEFDLSGYPAWAAQHERLAARPAFQRALAREAAPVTA